MKSTPHEFAENFIQEDHFKMLETMMSRQNEQMALSGFQQPMMNHP